MIRPHRSAVCCLAPLALGVLAGLTGCREQSVSYYEVPREPAPPAAPMAAAAAVTAARPAGARLEWDKPAAWTEQPGSAMRVASYAFTAPDGAKMDVSVTVFPDAAGGLLANINRWRGQVGLPPVTEGDLATAAERTTIAGLVSWVVNFSGTPPAGSQVMGATVPHAGPTRILGAIVPVGGSSWFFKLMGPDAVVASQREAFRGMLASMRAVTPAATTSAPSSSAPAPAAAAPAGGGMPGSEMTARTGSGLPPPAAAAGLSFTTPPGWQSQPATQFRVVNFTVPGPGVPPAEFYATPLTGAAGGEAANVNRWRSQLGLAALSEAEIAGAAQSITGPAGTFKIFDIESTGPVLKTGERARLLAAILARGDTSWFFRLTGEAGHVAAQREAFEQFLRSCRFENTP